MSDQKRKPDQPEQLPGQINYSAKPEIEGSLYGWFYVCGLCHSRINWNDHQCPVCKAGVNWNE